MFGKIFEAESTWLLILSYITPVSKKKNLEKIFQSRGIIPILEGPKFLNFYLKLFIRYEN